MAKLGRGGRWIVAIALVAGVGVGAVWLARRGGEAAPGRRARGGGAATSARPASADVPEPSDDRAPAPSRRRRTPAERRGDESAIIFGSARPASMHRVFMTFEYACDQLPRAACAEGRRLAPRCGAADVAACVALSELLDRAKHGDALYFRAAACELGHQPSCERWQRLDHLDVAYRRSSDDVGTPDDIAADCRAGDAEACGTQSHIESSNLHAIDLDAARRGCDAGFLGSCIALVEGSADPATTERVFARLCEQEAVHACKMLHAMYSGETIWDEWPAPAPDAIAAARLRQRVADLTGEPWEPPPRQPDDDEGEDDDE